MYIFEHILGTSLSGLSTRTHKINKSGFEHVQSAFFYPSVPTHINNQWLQARKLLYVFTSKEADAGGGDVPHDEMLIFKSCRKTVLWHQECMFEEDQNEKLDEAEVIIMHYFVAISPMLSSPS